MCVLIVKPKGVKMPSFTTLRACTYANPHGCGFATRNKWYRTLNFMDFVNELYKVRDDEECIIHFRLATHGSVKESNCHPFKQVGHTMCGHPYNVFFAHNGILDIPPRGDMTDSETAFQDIIMPVYEKYGDSEQLDDAVFDIIGSSRIVLLTPDNLLMYGDFSEWDDGCLYSNLRFTAYLKSSYRYAHLL